MQQCCADIHSAWFEFAWLLLRLALEAKLARKACRQAYQAWIQQRTEEIATSAEEGNLAPLWNLSKTLNMRRKRPKLALAPVIDEEGRVIDSHAEIQRLWAQQFSAEFSHCASAVSYDQLFLTLADFKQMGGIQIGNGQTVHQEAALPQSVEEWLDFVQDRITGARKGVQVGADQIPNEFHMAGGLPCLSKLAHLLWRVKHEGPPMAWRGGPMRAAPRKPHLLLSPFNARALLCADYKAKLFSSAIRSALSPVLSQLVAGHQSGAVKGGGT